MCFRPPAASGSKVCDVCGAENPGISINCKECGAELKDVDKPLGNTSAPIPGAPSAPKVPKKE